MPPDNIILNKLIKKKIHLETVGSNFGTNRNSKLPFIKLGCVPSLIYAGFLFSYLGVKSHILLI